MADEVKVEVKAEEVKNEAAEAEVITEETRALWPYATYPDGYKKLLNKIMPFWARPMKKMMGDLLIRVLVDG